MDYCNSILERDIFFFLSTSVKRKCRIKPGIFLRLSLLTAVDTSIGKTASESLESESAVLFGSARAESSEEEKPTIGD